MKKIISTFLAVAMMVSFSGCKSETNVTVEPEVKQVSALNEIKITWMGKTTSYTVGSKMTLNEFGQIYEIDKLYNDYSMEYTEDGAIKKINILKDDPEKNGYKTVDYENGIPVSSEYSPNDGFRSSKKSTITVEKDTNEQIIAMEEKNVYTDAEDGSTSRDVTKYEYEYDQNGKISEIKYFKDGKLDHTTQIGYDENGNMIKYANVGASNNSVYLSVEIIYEMVDETTVSPKDLDNFTAVNNFEIILNQIL